MICSAIVNSIGLVLDIVGAIVLFKYGFPPALENNRDGTFMISGSGDSQAEKEALKKDKQYKCLSMVGLIFLIIGFILQLISNFIK